MTGGMSLHAQAAEAVTVGIATRAVHRSARFCGVRLSREATEASEASADGSGVTVPGAPLWLATLSICTALVGLASGSARADELGYQELSARLGSAVPTGAGVPVCQVEANTEGGLTFYGPDQTRSEFVGKTFTAMSGTMSASWHASTVGTSFYGVGTSIAPGITSIFNYEANNWIGNFLRVNQSSSMPSTPPSGSRVMNHSWIGSAGAANDNQALRRLDFQANRDGMLHATGLNNNAGSTLLPLLSCSYNGIAVGRTDGQHSWGLTPTGTDGPGRMKPDIVAPGAATSWATPVVAAAAALLHQVASEPPLSANANALDPTVWKATLMAGAFHQEGWSNAPTASGDSRGEAVRPLDPVYGAGVVNVDRAHRILTGGEQDGSLAVPEQATLRPAGWDLAQIGPGTDVHWRLSLREPAPELSIVATWRRLPSTNFTLAPSAPTIRLRLFRVEGTTLVPLTGDQGAAYYASGNVASTSAPDNVQHIYVRGLVAGEYVIQASRLGSSGLPAPTGVAWFRPAIAADANWDGVVDGLDLSVVLSAWGTSVVAADLNSDGTVDGLDLAVILANWS
jgi:hypothetical protein